jgi:hypothetical protein
MSMMCYPKNYAIPTKSLGSAAPGILGSRKFNLMTASDNINNICLFTYYY